MGEQRSTVIRAWSSFEIILFVLCEQMNQCGLERMKTLEKQFGASRKRVSLVNAPHMWWHSSCAPIGQMSNRLSNGKQYWFETC